MVENNKIRWIVSSETCSKPYGVYTVKVIIISHAPTDIYVFYSLSDFVNCSKVQIGTSS